MKILKKIGGKSARCLLFASLFVLGKSVGYAQPKFTSVFGTSSCSNSNRLYGGNVTSPGAFTSIPSLNDVSVVFDEETKNAYKQSVYSKAGQLLFSVNSNGIFKPSGTMAFNFSTDGGDGSNPGTSDFAITVGTSTMNFAPRVAVSEISIFPVPGLQKCNSYYVLFLSLDADIETAEEIRCVRVDVNPTDGQLSFQDNLIIDPTNQIFHLNRAMRPEYEYLYSTALLVTDEENSDGSRDFYTVDPIVGAPDEASGCGSANMRKWTISSTGELPNFTDTYPSFLDHPHNRKGKILHIGDKKYLTYASIDLPKSTICSNFPTYSGPRCGSKLSMCDVNTGDDITAGTTLTFIPRTKRMMPDPADNCIQIIGFEYLPNLDKIIFSYLKRNELPSTVWAQSGLGYFSPDGTVTVINKDNSTIAQCGSSDLELSRDGNLLLVKSADADVNYNATSTDAGILCYLPVSSSSYNINTQLPIPLASSCSSSSTVKVFNTAYAGIRGTAAIPFYYLSPQIRGENYDNWGDYDFTNFEITTNQTWTPTNNPITNATGIVTSTISIRGDIHIPAGKTLKLKDMRLEMGQGAHINIDANETTSPVRGGRLYLDNSTLTRHAAVCGNVKSWGGVSLKANPFLPQLTFATGKQPGIVMEKNSEISYADIAILAGSYYTSSKKSIYSICGGGMVTIIDSRLVNNVMGVWFNSYKNFNPVFTGAYPPEIANISGMRNAKFLHTDNTFYPAGTRIIDIGGCNISGLKIQGCTFKNQTFSKDNHYAIYATDMNYKVDKYEIYMGPTYTTSFTNYSVAIHNANAKNTKTPVIRNSSFVDNFIGIDLIANSNAVVYNNVFDVPSYPTNGSSPLEYTSTNYHCIGVHVNGSNSFHVNKNYFNNLSTLGNKSTGVVVYSCGAGNNIVNSNTYTNLGIGNLSNLKNRKSDGDFGAITGLEFLCNTHINNDIDMGARGNSAVNHGMKIIQGTNDKPAGNIFSSYNGHNYNIYNPGPNTSITPGPGHEVGTLTYHYQNIVTGGTIYPAPSSKPGSISEGTANNYGAYDDCQVVGVVADPICNNPLSIFDGGKKIAPMHGSSGADYKIYAESNISYYMADANAMGNRDSLYYYLAQVPSPTNSMLTARLLVEDSLIDSANVVYDSIAYKFELDNTEYTEYTVYGRHLLNMAIKLRASDAITYDSKYFGAADTTINTDTITVVNPVDTVVYYDSLMDKTHSNQYGLSVTDVTAMADIYANATTWAKAWARTLLTDYAPQIATQPDLQDIVVADEILFPELGRSSDNSGGIGGTSQGSAPRLANSPASGTIQVVPNPATNAIQVQYTAAAGTFILEDITGRCVLKASIVTGSNMLDISNLTSGLYIYKVLDGATTVASGKLVKN